MLCSKCKIKRDKVYSNGYCNHCMNERSREYYKKNKELCKQKNREYKKRVNYSNQWDKKNQDKRREFSKKYYLLHRKQKLEKSKKYQQENKEKVATYNKFYKVKRIYGLSKDNYLKLLEKNNGLCPICKKSCEDWHVDHCHTTGKVRGLLCTNCNIGLGHFKESTETLSNAIAYLQQTLQDS